MTRVLALLPDMRVEPEHGAEGGDIVLMEWSASGTFAGQAVKWGGASRFTLRDGLVLEEVVYFDTLPLRALIDPSLRRRDLLQAADQPSGSPYVRSAGGTGT